MPHDPSWRVRYQALAADLVAALGPGWRVEHVGSTSVPGLPAKPVVDLALGIPDGLGLAHAAEPLNELGWSAPTPVGDHDALFLHDRHGVRSAIAHVFTAEQWPHAHPRLFAAWLRAHPDDRHRYADLVERDVWGGDYTAAKRGFVQDIVNRARAEQGLGPIALAR